MALGSSQVLADREGGAGRAITIARSAEILRSSSSEIAR